MYLLSEEYFLTLPQTKSDSRTWICDGSVPFIRDTIESYSTLQSVGDEWEAFVTWVRRRFTFPLCAGLTGILMKETSWFNAKNVPGLMICGACFLDKIGTKRAKDWDQVEITCNVEEYHGICTMGTLPIKMAWARLIAADDYDGFEALAKPILEIAIAARKASRTRPGTLRGSIGGMNLPSADAVLQHL